MRKVKALMLLIAFITLNINVINAQCMNHNSSMNGNNHQNHSVNNNNNNNNNMETSNINALSFKVEGNCGMCKNRIEKTALTLKGVNTAEWNEETHLLNVTVKPEIKEDDISKILANAGHDTVKFKADDKVYNALPMCCKYRK